jgi:hypothetical protein
LPSLFGASFKYERLKTPSSHIRLLELISSEETSANTSDKKVIECKISTYPLDKAPGYEALSYAWGNLAQDRLPVRLVECRFPKYKYTELRVTRNVYAALKRLRLPSESRLLWIDQICIDQSTTEDSLAEKNWQIKRMKDIYQTAAKTLIWLGDDDTDTSLVAEMLRRLPSMPDSALADTSYLQHCDQEILYEMIDFKICKDRLAKNRRDALVGFLNRQWFGRAWVYQEAVVSADLAVILGDYFFSFDVLVRLVYSTYTLAKEDSDRNTSRALKKTKGYGTLRAMWDDRRRFHNNEELDLLYILWSARKYLQASDPRDMVYSFLGVQNLECRVEPDYGKKVNMAHAFTTLACNMIQSTKDLSILQCVVPTRTILSDPAESREVLPSWVPNWSERPFLSGAPIVAPGLRCLFKASLDTKHIYARTLGIYQDLPVKAHIIDRIVKILPYKCGTTNFEYLKPALKLDDLVALFRSEIGYRPTVGHTKLREMALRTLLVDGAFSLMQPIDVEHSMADLLRIYDADRPRKGSESDLLIHRFLRTTAAVAAGKKLFVTEDHDLGLGYSNAHEGDLIVILHGCKTPCILRPSWRQPKSKTHFEFMGQCYVDGLMYGENVRGKKWWEEEAEHFVLV